MVATPWWRRQHPASLDLFQTFAVVPGSALRIRIRKRLYGVDWAFRRDVVGGGPFLLRPPWLWKPGTGLGPRQLVSIPRSEVPLSKTESTRVGQGICWAWNTCAPGISLLLGMYSLIFFCRRSISCRY